MNWICTSCNETGADLDDSYLMDFCPHCQEYSLIPTREATISVAPMLALITQRAVRVARTLYTDFDEDDHLSFTDTNFFEPENATFEIGWEQDQGRYDDIVKIEHRIPLKYLWEADWEKVLESERQIEAEKKRVEDERLKKKAHIKALAVAREAVKFANLAVQNAQRNADDSLEAAQRKLKELEGKK